MEEARKLRRVSEWMNERINEWMKEWMDGWMDGWMKEVSKERMNEWKNERTNERTNKWKNEWMKGYKPKWTHKFMERMKEERFLRCLVIVEDLTHIMDSSCLCVLHLSRSATSLATISGDTSVWPRCLCCRWHLHSLPPQYWDSKAPCGRLKIELFL